MTKPGNDQDRVQREIEELLGKLDNFVPEQRFTEKIRERARRQDASSPGPLARLRKRITRVSLGRMLLAGFVLIVFAYFFRGPLGGASTWLIGLGLAIAGIAFVLSIRRGGTSGSVGGTVEKRWRGQVIEYSAGPTAADRIRGWFRNRRRR
jgi:hypothetical protein